MLAAQSICWLLQWTEFRDYWIERGGVLEYGHFTDEKWHARLEEWSPRSSNKNACESGLLC